MHEAKTHFSQLVERMLAGEEVIVTRSGEPVMQFAPVTRSRVPQLGFAHGQIHIADDFDEMPEWFMREFTE